MKKIVRFLLASDRRRRRRTAAIALWLLRLARDAESEEMWRLSDILDGIDADVSRREYNAAEEDCLYCESALGLLESAIDDLEFAY